MTSEEIVKQKCVTAKAHKGSLGWYVIFQFRKRVLLTDYHKRECLAWADAASRLQSEREERGER